MGRSFRSGGMKGFNEMSVAQIEIEIISDLVCPWCYLGQRRLQLALEQVQDEVVADISWKPYQLEPGTPPEGLDAQQYLQDKMGSADAVTRAFDMITQLAEEVDLPMQLEKATRLPNTLDAHRVIHWAGLVDADTQDRVARGILQANFVEGLDVGDTATLGRVAADCGMDSALVEHKLASDEDRSVVLSEIEHAQRIGVTGVPCYIIDRKYAITGAQSVDVFVNALRQIAESKRAAAE